jgi:hypothetical protein
MVKMKSTYPVVQFGSAVADLAICDVHIINNTLTSFPLTKINIHMLSSDCSGVPFETTSEHREFPAHGAEELLTMGIHNSFSTFNHSRPSQEKSGGASPYCKKYTKINNSSLLG